MLWYFLDFPGLLIATLFYNKPKTVEDLYIYLVCFTFLMISGAINLCIMLNNTL